MTILHKYPRSKHLPWSPGGTRDDRRLIDCDHFFGKEIVVTEKLDGENSSLYRDAIHARSLSSSDHLSRNWLKGLWGKIRWQIPEGYRICGENLYAVHSIEYKNLGTYFKVFNIWDENNTCISWDDTIEWCELLGLDHVKVLHRGIFSEDNIKSCWKPEMNGQQSEGYVVRLANSFQYKDFSTSLAKMVRKNHVQTSSHWIHSEIKTNKL